MESRRPRGDSFVGVVTLCSLCEEARAKRQEATLEVCASSLLKASAHCMGCSQPMCRELLLPSRG
eukprot:5270132-Amphidinium_carterae.1